MTNDIIEKYSQIYGSPFLVGVMMGVNAIKDAALYIDGPDCIFYKADMIFKTHDIYSKLKAPSVDTKLYFSGVMPNKMVRGYDEQIKRKLGFINDNEKFNLGVVTCMPVTGLLAIQYDNLYSDFEKDFIFVPSFTDKFWLDGYSIFLKELAKKIELDVFREKKEKHISIVGYLFDRNEGDNFGNIEEITRILSLMGVNIDTIWLNGGNYSDLKKIENSELIISLPYGEFASKVLSKKLNIDYLSLEVPFGIKNTINFLKKIGEKLGIDKKIIENAIKNEFNFIKEKVSFLDENVFLAKNFLYAGDPFLESGIKDISDFLGMNFIKGYSYTGTNYFKEEDLGEKEIDFVIGNSEFSIGMGKNIEFGFPSYNTHYINNRAFMGFRGFLNFVESIYNSLNKNSL